MDNAPRLMRSDSRASDRYLGHARLAWVKTLSGRLMASPTACAALAAWCAEHGLCDGPILAERSAMRRATRPDDTLLDALSPGRGEALRHRQVTLVRGGLPLSDCDLWWLPGRLEPAMVAALETTDTPFGTAVVPMRPTRRTLFEAVLPSGGAWVLEHQAVVLSGLGERRPIAAVRELYRATLAPHTDAGVR